MEYPSAKKLVREMRGDGIALGFHISPQGGTRRPRRCYGPNGARGKNEQQRNSNTECRKGRNKSIDMMREGDARVGAAFHPQRRMEHGVAAAHRHRSHAKQRHERESDNKIECDKPCHISGCKPGNIRLFKNRIALHERSICPPPSKSEPSPGMRACEREK